MSPQRRRLLPGSTKSAASRHKQGNRRGQYVRLACDDCKRRKARCDGNVPCQNCQNRSVVCHYNCSSATCCLHGKGEYDRTARIPSVQPSHALNEVHSTPAPTSLDQRMSGFYGLSSSEYYLRIASLQLRQRASEISDSTPSGRLHEVTLHLGVEAGLGDSSHLHEDVNLSTLRASETWALEFGELAEPRALELLQVYDETFGVLHPVLRRDFLDGVLRAIYGRRDRGEHADPQPVVSCHVADVLIFKLVLCIATLAEGTDEEEMTKYLHNNLQAEVLSYTTAESVGLTTIVVMLLWSVYNFHKNQVRLAWRFCGVSVAMIHELGFHRGAILSHTFKEPTDRDHILAVVWTAYILDQGWSSALGLPPRLRVNDVQNNLPLPDKFPYLQCMASYCHLGDQVLDVVFAMYATKAVDEDRLEYLHFRIQKWKERALKSCQTEHPLNVNGRSVTSYETLSALLSLRANQLQILLYRSFLHLQDLDTISHDGLEDSLRMVSDTIEILHGLELSSETYENQLPLFSHFLLSSFSLLLLVVVQCSRPITAARTQSQQQWLLEQAGINIGKAVQLARTYSHKSRTLKRLAEHIESLRDPLFENGICVPAVTRGEASQPPTNGLERDTDGTSRDESFWDNLRSIHDLEYLNYNVPVSSNSDSGGHLSHVDDSFWFQMFDSQSCGVLAKDNPADKL